MVDRGPVIGRERRDRALDQALGSARLLTLTGAGGCGKTRVAVELADRVRLRAEPLDALVVELASARTAEQVVDAVLRALGARDRGGRTPIEVLLDSVAVRPASASTESSTVTPDASFPTIAKLSVPIRLAERAPVTRNRDRARGLQTSSERS